MRSDAICNLEKAANEYKKNDGVCRAGRSGQCGAGTGQTHVVRGVRHDVYLGCLNCSDVASDSVDNEIGQYGSDISPQSIFNEGQYGSGISPESPCNDIASNPPVIVDQNGGLYGYLTLNDAHPKAVIDQDILAWLKYKVCKVRD